MNIDQVISQLREVYDPEMESVNVYDLGLIYDIKIDEKNCWVEITHTLTSAFCPFADSIVEHVEVITVFDPPFTMEMVPEETRLMMGWI